MKNANYLDCEYDAIVVGSGPAGSMAAKFAAEGGASVLVVDRRNEIGSPVRCAEGVPLTAERLEGTFGVGFSSSFVAQEIKGWALIAPSGRRRVFKGDKANGFVAERQLFDRHLATAASAAGAKIVTSTNAAGLVRENGKIEGVILERFGETLEVKTGLVIAADGICSRVARMAGFDTVLHPHELDSCLQYEMHGVDMDDPELLEVYFGNKIAPRGYVWIFPKGGKRANVGIGVAGDSPVPASRYLDAFVNGRDDLRKASIVQVNAGLISVSLPLRDMVKDGIIVSGTAARHVDPVTGGGIWMAMGAGKAAGIVAAEAVREGDFSKKFLDRYSGTPEVRNITASIEKSYKVRIALEHMTDDDFDSFVGILPDDFGQAGAIGMMKVIARNPKLSLKFLKYLM